MKKLGELSKFMVVWGEDKVRKLEQAQFETGQDICEDVKALAPVRTGKYQSSITTSMPMRKDNKIITQVYTDLPVGGDNPKWSKLPLGCFLEWGTGPLGEDTNTFPHGYPYTTDQPWNIPTKIQFEKTGTWGMMARPHFVPALQMNKDHYKRKLREALRK